MREVSIFGVILVRIFLQGVLEASLKSTNPSKKNLPLILKNLPKKSTYLSWKKNNKRNDKRFYFCFSTFLLGSLKLFEFLLFRKCKQEKALTLRLRLQYKMSTPVSTILMLPYSVVFMKKENLLRLYHWCFPRKLLNFFKEL